MAKNDQTGRVLRRCSFCGKSQSEVRRLIAGPNVCICNECVDLCRTIMGEDPGVPMPVAGSKLDRLPTPVEMKAMLDDYVIGQERAKRALCVSV